MTVIIRMKRTGSKKNAHFRLVVCDSRSPKEGRFIEELGSYDPHKTEEKTKLKLERIRHWITAGAQTSQTVKTLLKKAGIF